MRTPYILFWYTDTHLDIKMHPLAKSVVVTLSPFYGLGELLLFSEGVTEVDYGGLPRLRQRRRNQLQGMSQPPLRRGVILQFL